LSDGWYFVFHTDVHVHTYTSIQSAKATKA
jgi:hypothetical protein